MYSVTDLVKTTQVTLTINTCRDKIIYEYLLPYNVLLSLTTATNTGANITNTNMTAAAAAAAGL